MARPETNADLLRQEIGYLLQKYPDLADDEILRADMLEGSTGLHEVLTDLVRMVEDAKALHNGTDQRLAELKSRKDRFMRRIEFGRELIARVMDTAQVSKVELPEASLSMRNNPQQVIGDPDPETLPDDLCKITRSASKQKIRDAMLAGREVPGCTLSNAPPSLMMRVK